MNPPVFDIENEQESSLLNPAQIVDGMKRHFWIPLTLTFLGLAGVGDLFLTCSGALSRNRTLGLKVAEGVDPEAYLASVSSVAEGFWTSAATFDLAQRLGVDMPITEQVFHVLHRRRPLLDALRLLLTREFKDELTGIRGAAGGRSSD